MAFHTTCFTVTPSAGTPPYSLDFSGVTLTASVPPTGNVIDVSAYLSGAGAPAPFTAAYGAPSDNLTTDLAAGQIITSAGPVTLRFDANILAYAGQTGYLGFSGDVVVTDIAGCVQTVRIPDGYSCPFEAVFQNTPPNCPAIAPITCTAGDVIDFTSPVFTDANGSPVSISILGLPSWLTFVDNGDGTFDLDGTSPNNNSNTNMTVTASDGTDTCTTSVSIICTGGVNTAPTCPPNQTVDCATDLPYTSSMFIDPDSDSLTMSQTGLPSGYTFTDNGNGTYTISGSGASASVQVTASDGNGGTCTQTLTVTGCVPAIVPPADCPFSTVAVEFQPVFPPFGPYGTFTGGTAPITLTQVGLSSTFVFADVGNGTWTISVTPTSTPSGVEVYTVTATDANGQTAECVGNTAELMGN